MGADIVRRMFRKRILIVAVVGVALVAVGLKGAQYLKEPGLKEKANRLRACGLFFRELVSYGFNDRDGKKIVDHDTAYNMGDKPLGSWRLMYLYMINFWNFNGDIEESLRVENRFNPIKSWNEEPNYSFHFDLLCWNNNPFSKRYNETCVMAIAGKDTAFEAFQKATRRDYEEIYDRCSSTILFVEAVRSGVHWGRPGDFNVETVTKEQLFPGKTRGIVVIFGDESVWYIKRTIPMETLKIFMTIESSQGHDRQQELTEYGRLMK
jgi:hypothetical protein